MRHDNLISQWRQWKRPSEQWTLPATSILSGVSRQGSSRVPNNPQRTDQTSNFTVKALEGQACKARHRTEPAEGLQAYGDFDSACIVLAPPTSQHCIPLTIQRGASSRPRLNQSINGSGWSWRLAFWLLSGSGQEPNQTTVNICDVISQRK